MRRTLDTAATATSAKADRWHTMTSRLKDLLCAQKSTKKKCSTNTRTMWNAK
jgi:hypothetical protein